MLEKVMEGTGVWIFDHEKFIDWRSKKIKVLWGTGIRTFSAVYQSKQTCI
jgi:hypothetical protein